MRPGPERIPLPFENRLSFPPQTGLDIFAISACLKFRLDLIAVLKISAACCKLSLASVLYTGEKHNGPPISTNHSADGVTSTRSLVNIVRIIVRELKITFINFIVYDTYRFPNAMYIIKRNGYMNP